VKYPYPMAVVEWNDAYRMADETDAEDAKALPMSRRCVLVGWLVADNEAGVRIASEYDAAASGTLRGVWMVPRAMVVNVRVLGRRWAGGKKVKNEGAD